MQFKIFLAVSITLLISLAVTAQTIRKPFADIDKEEKVLTLTNGKYEEFFDDDSLQRIGTALININTMKIVKLQLTEDEQRIMDNSAASRFLNVDPLTSSYPTLTPYQYASNRPIDGIDLDGLEYVTYTIVIDKKTTQIQSITYNWFNENQHNAHGSLGQGVTYDIRYYDSQNKLYTFENRFVSRNASTLFGVVSTEYGNYMGATALFNVNGSGKFTGKYDYNLPAVDAVDNFAKLHDKGYDNLNAVGASGLFNDWGTTPVDEAALSGWQDFRKNFNEGESDPFNGQSVTSGERSAAWRGIALFSDVVSTKKIEISSWMSDNYKGEAKFSVKPGMKGTPDNKVVNFNYQLFLQKYLMKDDKDNWIRNSKMWNKDDKGNYTPKKPGE